MAHAIRPQSRGAGEFDLALAEGHNCARNGLIDPCVERGVLGKNVAKFVYYFEAGTKFKDVGPRPADSGGEPADSGGEPANSGVRRAC